MRTSLTFVAALLSAGMALAQTGGTQAAPAQGTAAPGAQAQGAAGQTSGAPRQPQAKSKAEFDDYQAAAQLTDPNQTLAAADTFVQKYPDSELKELLYVQAMNRFQQQNAAEKEIAAGRKAIAIDPTDPIPLIHVSSALVEVTRENDLDKEQRYAEAAKDAQAAITNIDSGLHVPPNAPPDQVTAVKNNIVATGYETLGVIDMNKQDFAGAETNLNKAVDAAKADPVARIYLRLSVAQDNLKKFPEALDSANKALQYAQEGTPEKNLAKQQQARLQKLVQGGGTQASVPSPQATPNPSAAPTPAGTPSTTGTAAGTVTPQPH